MKIRALQTGAAVLALLTPSAIAERWEMQYLYDEAKSELVLNDIRFASARRGVAVGYIREDKHEKPTALVTSDGGAHWALVPLKESGVSLFFVNENVGWMVTAKGLWVTNEAGRNWRKIGGAPKGMMRVFFLNEKHGFAVGAKKSVWESQDGGEHWAAVPAAAEPDTKPENTMYTWVFFANQRDGIISGWSLPPRPGEDHLPDWIEPDQAIRRAEYPHLSLTLQTRDGGAHWTADTTSMFGRLTRTRFGPLGMGLALVEFAESFAWFSEVYRINTHTGKSERAYREKNRAITDVWVSPSGEGYLAGVEMAGQLRFIPGKVKVLHSRDLQHWTELPVDYRAVATRATLALADDRNIWMATDTGMVLKLAQ